MALTPHPHTGSPKPVMTKYNTCFYIVRCGVDSFHLVSRYTEHLRKC